MFAASASRTNHGILARKHGWLPSGRSASDDRLIASLEDKVRSLEATVDALQIDLRDQEKLLRDKIAQEAEIGYQISAAEIIASVSVQHKIPIALIKGPRRAVALVAARHHAMYEVARQCHWLSLPEIGRIFGGRDHTTIIHAVREWPAKAAERGIPVVPIENPRIRMGAE